MKVTAILAVCLLLTGCFGTTEKLVVKTELVDKPILYLPEPLPVQQLPIGWIIITKDNYEEVFSKIEKSGGTISFIALTPEGYQNLSLNVAEMRRYILQQNANIKALKEYYEKPSKPKQGQK